MILANLEHSYRYQELHPAFKKVFDYVKSYNLLDMDLGKITLDGEDVFIINSEAECIPAEKQILEYHQRYIDIQILLSGKETIAWKNTYQCKEEKEPYHSENDYGLFFDKPSVYVHLQPGDFAIFFPEDAHGPIIGEGKIRKLIAKVKV